MERTITFLILLPLLKSVNGDCDQISASIPTFGKNCEYRCHCANDAKCNTVTGCVNNLCEHGWMGPLCQYRNIMINYVKVAQKGENSDQHSELAVDGKVNTCSETNIGAFSGPQYWEAHFEREQRIAGVKLYVKENDLDNFRGFRIETGQSNTSNPHICYQHPDARITSIMEIACQAPVMVKYLRITLDLVNVPLRLCEVQIYGGREVAFNQPAKQSSDHPLWLAGKAVDGRYPLHGESSNVEELVCSRTRGAENNPWWQVDLEKPFVIYDIYFFGRPSTSENSFGFYISVGNSSDSTKEIFHDEYGRDGNPSLYQPRKTELNTSYEAQIVKLHLQPYAGMSALSICELQVFADCPRNKCGFDCEIDCYCKEEVIGPMKIEGTCLSGCSERWTGKNGKCDTECSKIQWGEECQNECGNCKELPCDIQTGHCEDGCAGPWIPPLCVKGCERGKYGNSCEQSCGHCVNGTSCNSTTGNCSHGCDPGWQGPKCDIECGNGKYGRNCLGRCGKCVDNMSCDPYTGKCVNGCHPGYRGEFCDKDTNMLYQIKNQSIITMSSTHSNWAPYRAVDGILDDDPLSCQCCSGSRNEKESFWRIDLPKMYPIMTVIVYGRKNEEAFRDLNGFDIILRQNASDPGVTKRDNKILENNMCEIELSNTLAKSIEIRRPGILTICEIRVVEGECQVGRFGDECKRKCHCADNQPCDRETGKCNLEICKIGYSGPACDEDTVSSASLPTRNLWLTLMVIIVIKVLIPVDGLEG